MDTLRAKTIDWALSGKLRPGALPRLALPVEDAARGFAALTRPAEVLQVVLTYG
jgi:threonine dehydrogenase-like Zn-dependent dehydrogenase